MIFLAIICKSDSSSLKGLPFLAIIFNQFFPFMATFRSIKSVIFGNILFQFLARTSYCHFSISTLTKAFSLYSVPMVCYGFEVMKSSESPRHPFNIFQRRLQTPPQVIIYDNACKLHQYSLIIFHRRVGE